MPTYREITVTIQSQHDILAIPESLLPRHSSDTGRASPMVEVTIPKYPGSQFWIAYKCSPPNVSLLDTEYTQSFFYFKLKINHRCLLSWGVGANEEWKGKAVFAIFQAEPGHDGNKSLEKRAFFFPMTNYDCGGELFSLEVFRAKARRREPLNIEGMDTCGAIETPFCMMNAGRMRRSEPRRKYTYALIDAVDTPYVTFRYHSQSPRASSVGRFEELRVESEDNEEQSLETSDKQLSLLAGSPHSTLDDRLDESSLCVPETRITESISVSNSSGCNRGSGVRSRTDESTTEQNRLAETFLRDSSIQANSSPILPRWFMRAPSPSPTSGQGKEFDGTKTTSQSSLKRTSSLTGFFKNSLRKTLLRRNNKDY